MSAWIAFAFLSMILATAAAITQKKTLKKEHAMEYSAVMTLCAAILTIPLWFKINWSNLNWQVVGLMYFNSILAGVAYLLVAKAIRHMEISIVSPLLMIGPAFTAIAAWLLIGEQLTKLQLGGLALLITGTYVLEAKQTTKILKPFKRLFESRYTKFILAALTIYAITGTIDKKIVGTVSTGGFGISATTYIPLIHAFLAINYFIMLSYFHDGYHGIMHGFNNAGGWIFAVALLTVGYRLAQQHALTFEASKVALVVAIKKTSALTTTLIGGELFHEKHLFKKTLACVIMVAGAIMIIT